MKARRPPPPLPWTANRAARRRGRPDTPVRIALPLVGGGQGRSAAAVRRAGDALLVAITWALVGIGATAVIVSVLYVATMVARRAA